MFEKSIWYFQEEKLWKHKEKVVLCHVLLWMLFSAKRLFLFNEMCYDDNVVMLSDWKWEFKNR